MHSTADQDALQQGAAPAVLPKPDGQEPNQSPLPDVTENDKQSLMTSSNGGLADAKSETTPNPANEHATTPTTTMPPPTNTTTEDTPAAKILHFLATATPESLAGVAVGFAAVTYFTLGRLGLVLIGAFGGVVGFISWEQRNPEVSKAVRGERGVDIIERILHDSTKMKLEDKAAKSSDDEDAIIRGLDDFRPETREALGGLIDAVIRDYVKWWYSPIIPQDHSFPLACRKTITSYLLTISNHMSRKRPADAFLDLLTNSSSIVIVFMSELAAAFQDLPPDSNMTATDAMYNYLAANPDCHLANLLNQRQQAAKFKMVAEDMLGFLDRNSYSCDPLRVFLREILANSVLEKTLQTCSKAEWINGWIVYLLEAGEPNLNQAIDSGMQTGPDASQNVLIDLDGNVGNVGIAKPTRISLENDRGRRKEVGHKKKLSKAEEELEEAMEEMKRMNDMIAQEEARLKRDSTATDVSQSLSRNSVDSGNKRERFSTSESSTGSGSNGAKPLPSAASTDGFSIKSDTAPTPLTPQSPIETSSPTSLPKSSDEGTVFTSFDQIVPQGQAEDEEEAPKKAPLTLHNAAITVHDDAGGDTGRIRAKPNWDYWVQVEISVVGYSGWMIVRRYADFETLHEILRRIATISGATAFTELHKDLPNWKIHTRESLRGELERYLRDACWYKSLAESEGMKRFLEKSQGHTHSDSKSFGWESVSKGMLDVLSTAPKGAVEGGKTLVGGVTGVFGNLTGLNRRATNQSVDLTTSSSRLSLSTPPRRDSMKSPARSARDSLDSQRSSVISTQPGKMPPMERRPSYQSQGDSDFDHRRGRSDLVETGSAPASARPSREHSRAPSLAQLRSPSAASLEFMKLPPPPDQIADDYGSPINGGDMHGKMTDGITSQKHVRNGSQQVQTPPPSVTGGKKGPLKTGRQYSQLSEGETRVAVELLFAVINEMYTLSSAWNIRRTLLTAAKSFLLRPGNPSLLTVQNLIQTSVIDGNTSDAGIAAHFRKLRENMLPTEQELAEWPPEPTAEEKERLRIKARKLLIQSGVPAALMGVMGQAATGEALGRVFDCLQIEEVARGLIFGLILQVVRIVTH